MLRRPKTPASTDASSNSPNTSTPSPRSCAPHDQAIARASGDLDTARQRHRAAERDLAASKRRHRRAARHEVARTADQVATATTQLDEITRQAQPHLDTRSKLQSERRQLRRQATTDRHLYRSFFGHDDRLHAAERTLQTLDEWHTWALGQDVTPERLIDAGTHLQRRGGDHACLAAPLLGWLDDRGITRPDRTIEPPSPAIEPLGLDIGF